MAGIDSILSTAVDAVQYRGIARLPNGKWCSYIVNREGRRLDVGEFETAAAAALAHDRAILAILGPDASSTVLNFRAAFSDTELRFLHGLHAPVRAAGVVSMLRAGDYDAELARFAACAFDAYLEPDLALDVASFRLVNGDVLGQRKKAATTSMAPDTDPAALAEAELDVEREVFVEAAKNKATGEAWVESYHRRRQQTGPTFEDENRWPLVLPAADVGVGDWFTGEELIYLPHGSSYVDEMMVGRGLVKNAEPDACMHVEDFLVSTPARE